MTKAVTGPLADREQTVRTPPRFAIRTFWLLHRALYRFTGSRIGLARPEAGDQLGMDDVPTAEAEPLARVA